MANLMNDQLTEFTEAEKQAIANRRTITRFFFFPFQILAMVCIALQWPLDAWYFIAALILVTSYFMFCWTSCFHECAHQTLFRSQRLSVLLGRILGTLMFVSYTSYRESHIRHHAYLNKPVDWELWPYSDPKASLTFRRLFVWFDLFVGIFSAPIIYGRIFWHKDSPLSAQSKAACRYEYFLIVLFWASILGVVAYYNKWLMLLTVWVLPHCLAGLYQNARKLTEHLGMNSYDPLMGTRTVAASNFWTRLCTFLNFDIFVHGPHHRHPRVSHDQLVELTQQYVETNPQNNYPIFSTYVGAFSNMFPWLFKNPGVGVNAGGEFPAEAKQGVTNFAADVTDASVEETEVGSANLTGTASDG